MAVLNEQNRFDTWAEWMRQNTGSIGITKAELRAAVDAVDDWVDTNTVSFNNAIPQPARGALSADQKTALLVYVVLKRRQAGA